MAYHYDPSIKKCTRCEFADIREVKDNRLGVLVPCSPYYICTLHDGERISRVKKAETCDDYSPEQTRPRTTDEKVKKLFEAMGAAELFKVRKESDLRIEKAPKPQQRKKEEKLPPVYINDHGRKYHVDDYKAIQDYKAQLKQKKERLEQIRQSTDHDEIIERNLITRDIFVLKNKLKDLRHKVTE